MILYPFSPRLACCACGGGRGLDVIPMEKARVGLDNLIDKLLLIIARRAIVFAKYRQGQGKRCVNRVRPCVCLSVWLVCTFAQCWFLESEIQKILDANTRRKIAKPCSSCLDKKFAQCVF